MSNLFCTKSPNGRHNFPIPGGDCVYGCGANQTELSGGMRKVQPANPFERALRPRKPPKGIHSERHELIAKMRENFGETAAKGVGSFSFYLGLLKNVPISTLYMWLAQIKDSPKLDTPLARRKIFCWKYKQWKNPPQK